jgi:shikimate kinase
MLYQPKKPIVLVGLMGVGKTTVGKRLAKELGLTFVDLDHVIEEDQGCTIPEIFDYAGEDTFRLVESRLLEIQLEGPAKVLATGGGAFIGDENRALIKQKAISVWLQARLGSLIIRTAQRGTRPLLDKGDHAKVLEELMETRNPIYALADFSVETDVGPHNKIIDNITGQIEDYDT